ncbi:T9SS type A sorting domain-containing protein [Carboxylicivirga sp. N1Y90]|uniref:T9SS type A sorting domain-containing protein n=1 Tax=Carboxylicivirga fragile TaxID=3417571 RepID=UPI003D32C0AF|nr:T9SS type A sorting domain-containing protein [Marinilabiliaceae bacterium N1Y90]
MKDIYVNQMLRKFLWQRVFTLCLFISVSVLGLLAQSGPAGIGNTDGSNGQPKVILWLDAESLSLSNGDDIATWSDMSGNGNDLTQTDPSFTPIFRSAALNGKAIAEFSKSNNRIRRLNFDMPQDESSIFVVAKTSDSGEAYVSYAVSSDNNEFLLFDAAALRSYISGSNVASSKVFDTGNWHVLSHTWDNTSGYANVYKDNDVPSANSVSTTLVEQLGCFAIGGEQDAVDGGYDAAQAFTGDIAEVIVYDKKLSIAEVAIVNNYLNLKYAALDTDFPIANDGFNNANAGAHINDFGGTGVESDGASITYSTSGLELQSDNLSSGNYVYAAHNGVVNNLTNIQTGLTNADGAWGRSWYVQRIGSFDPQLTFNLDGFENGKYFSSTTDYVLLYKASEGGTYTVVSSVASLNGSTKITFTVDDGIWNDGYYTLGSTDLSSAPLEGVEGVTYYAWLNDDWDNSDTWSTQENSHVPNGLTPTTSPTSAIDKVVIKNGVTVSISTNNKSNAILEVRGTLNLQSTIGHSWDKINGIGRILLETDEFPAGDATRFVSAGMDEGTVVYKGTGFDFLTAREFFNLEIELSTSTDVLTLLNDISVNGNLYIKRGILNINNASATNALNIDVDGNLWVQSNGSITTGTADARHQLNLYGDFTNNGSVRFTNRTSQTVGSEATDGIVDFNLLSTSSDQAIQLNGISNFYRIEIDKGIDQTYIASIDADDASYFNLFGYANQNHTGDLPYRSTNDNALGLVAGTVKLGANISILTLSSNGNYDIPERARLWIDGATVLNNSGSATVPYGTFQISGGLFESKVSSGITTRKNGLIKVEGGIVNTNVIRTSVLGSTNVGGYVQSGGTMNLISGSMSSSYYRFSMTYPGNVFNMSGGTLNIQQSGGLGGIFVNSDPQNINVTGGTVICNVSTGSDFNITSKAPFYNLRLTNSAGNTNNHVLSSASNVGGSENVSAQPLVVLNDLSIETDAFLYHNGEDISVGRNFSIAEDAQKQTENGTNNYGLWFRDNASAHNTLTFNGTGDGEFYIGHNVDDAYELYLYNVVVNKPEAKKLTLTGDTNKEASNVGTDWHARLFRVFNNMSVESGLFDQGEHAIRLYGPLNVSSGAQCGVYEDGVTHIDALIMFKDANIEINTEDGAILGNIKMNPAPNTEIVSLTSDVIIKRISYYHGRVNIGSHNLKVDYIHRGGSTNPYRVSDGNANTEMIFGAGNASDGGLSVLIPEGTADNSNLAFPIGVLGKYTPVNVNVANVPTGGGYLTITPVDAELQTTNIANGGNMLSYYWKLTNAGFTTSPDVKFVFTYDEADVPAQENLFVPGKVLSVDPYSRLYIDDVSKVDDSTNEITYDDGSGGRFPLDIANYTAGRENRFTGSVSIFYTRDHGNSTGTAAREPRWTDQATWTRNDILVDANGDGTIDEKDWHDSRQPATPNGGDEYPEAGDIAVIGWVPWTDTNKPSLQGQPHGVWIDNTQEQVAELVFNQMKDVSGNPTERVYRSGFQFRPTLCINNWSGELTADLVKGEGMFWNRIGDPDFSLMDIGDFAANDSSYIVYENFSNPRTINNIPDVVPNLVLANDGWGGNDYDITIEKDITTNGNFEILGDANILLHNGATGDLNIGENLVFFQSDPSEGSPSGGGAQLLFANNGTARTVDVGGDIVMDNDASLIAIDSPTTGGLEHSLNVYGNIYQASNGGGIDGLKLWTASNEDRVLLSLIGDESMTYTYVDGDVPDFYRIIVDKGTSQTATAQFDGNFTLNGPTSGVGVSKALELNNGTFIINDASVAFALTSGDDDYYIPSSAGLQILQGALTANGNSNIILDGTLDVNNGSLDMSGGDNNIEYSASGNAVLEIGTTGSLTVGGQVRGALAADEGILKYRQSGGNVIIGESTASEGGRGVLEVHNVGSEFTFTAGTLEIVRQQSSPVRAALYLQPDVSSVGSSMTIQLGNASTPASQEIGLHSSIALPNVHIDNSSSNSPAVKVWIEDLTINNNLDIDSGASFDCDGLDLTIGGNLINDGSFTPGANTTIFIGSIDQSITGSSDVTFNDLVKSGESELEINGNITVDGVFTLNGSLSDNDNTIALKGNFINDGNHIYGGSGSGIIMNGSSLQNMSGTGSVGKLRVNNIAGVKVLDGSNVFINSELELESGVFDIGGNLLTMGQNATISDINSFGASNMIQTTKSYVDAGVKQLFNSFSGPGTQDLVFPMGSNGIYTPVDFTINSITSSNGSITVKASHEVHPTIIDDSEAPDIEIVDEENALQFYWILRSDQITDFDATVNFYGKDELALTNSPTYEQSDYITARLLNDGSFEWTKHGQDTYDETTDKLTFTFAGTNDIGISGDYTAGVEPQTATKKGAIPDEVPVYTTISDGNWADAIWSPIAPAGGPQGARVELNHNVSMSTNFVTAYTTTINSTGRLSLGSSYGHRLGDIYGTGVLHISDGAMPSASYNDFVTASGGTFDFDGTLDYSVLSNFIEVNNVIFTGTGERQLPNSNLNIHGNVEISGADADLVLVNLYNKSYYVEKDMTLTTGGFTAGIDDATFTFNGTAPQNLLGDFTSTNGFNNLEINNVAGLTIGNPVEVTNKLILTNGLINTTTTNILTITNPASSGVTGGGVGSYVDGPLRKRIPNNDTFEFPIGNNARLGKVGLSSIQSGTTGIWEAEYVAANPSTGGYDPDIYQAPINYVSRGEYWRILGPATAESNVTIRWDNTSGVSVDANERNNLRIVEWKDLVTDEWQDVGDDIVDGGATNGTITSTSLSTFNELTEGNIFTWGSITPSSIFDWLGGDTGFETDWFRPANWSQGSVPNISSDVEIGVTANQPIILGNAFVKDLTLDPSTVITMSPGSQFTIDGNLINNGLLTVQNNNSDNMSSFINNGTISGVGNERVEFTFDPGRYWYIGLPLNGATGGDFYASDDSRGFLYQYEGGWSKIANDSFSFDTEPLRGFSTGFINSELITLEGRFRYSNYSHSIQTGWELVANPYPSFIDVTIVGAWNFDDVAETIYTRTTHSSVRDVATYNLTTGESVNGGSKVIAPMQSFWVKANKNGNFGINKEARVHSVAKLKSSATLSDVFRMKLDNGLFEDELAMVLRPNGSHIFSIVDSEKKIDNNKDVAYLYSLKQGKRVAVNLLPEADVIEKVSLGYKVDSDWTGSLILKATNLGDFDADIPIFLEDKLLKIFVNLREEGQYEFNPTIAQNEERFVIHFTDASIATDIDEHQAPNDSGIRIWGDLINGYVHISDELLNESESDGRINIYSMNGILIKTIPFEGLKTSFVLPEMAGVYIIEARVGDARQTQKIVKEVN